MPSTQLRNPETGIRCGIELDRGLDYSIEAATEDALDALLGQLLAVPGSQVAHGIGGMVNNINVFENIALPVVYHAVAPVSQVEREVYETFAACGVDSTQAEELCAKRPGNLSSIEKRVAGFVRALLMRPGLLVYSRFFEGLTRAQMERVAALHAVFRERHPDGTAVYLQLSDMPVLQPRCHQQFVT
jgi:predicted ABC-type transport system involved in lysophospholipase L1 biosynthesis ATPase subunit